jgi:hypothetical protein
MTDRGPLDRPLPPWVRAALLLLCALIPTLYVARQYERRHDLSPIIDYGQFFAPRQLPEIRAMHPALGSFSGFDGQFYVQIALDPALRRPELPPAVDNLSYRGQRILLPALAWLLGAGRPAAIVRIYALLNLGFFYLLLAVLARRLPAVDLRRFLVLGAIVLTTGSLVSVEYAMTDLPAATFAVISLGLAEIPAGLFLALAILTKPTYALFLLGRVWPLPHGAAGWRRRALLFLLAAAPFFLWEDYLLHICKGGVVDTTQFTLPFVAWGQRAVGSWQVLAHAPAPWRDASWIAWWDALFQFLALCSSNVQVAFLALRPRLRNPVWIFGAAFAILMFCLPEKTLIDAEGYTRTVLPMAIAFNLLLLELRTSRGFLVLLVLGNIGLLEGLAEMIWITGS